MKGESRLTILDSTLRDGAQAEGISFSVEDKLKIVEILDALGIDYIEAGNPGSNPKDIEFFERIGERKNGNSVICAFGSTRKKGIRPEEDGNLSALLGSGVDTVVIFGKSWDFHVTEILKTTHEENLTMIEDTIRYLKEKGKQVIFDAEHFFDGYNANSGYALECLAAAEKGGADIICLCDTNGGTFPDRIYSVVTDVKKHISVPVGIHAHNDTGMAVANTIMAVKAGAEHIQGTLIGYGERCGNANLSTVIGNLQGKNGEKVIENLSKLTSSCREVAEISNIRMDKSMPYVGTNAFTHKGGMHIDGVNKNSRSFEHISPETVGNERHIVVSEMAGKGTLVEKIKKFYPELTKTSPEATEIIHRMKEMEYKGYQYEGADASFLLLARRTIGDYKPAFTVEKFKTIGEKQHKEHMPLATATVKIKVGEETEITAAEGHGPVNALDLALRKALMRFYPELEKVHLQDYKVRILDGSSGTAAVTRVLIDSTDGSEVWTTVGVSEDIIEASMIALSDSLQYKLSKEPSRLEGENK